MILEIVWGCISQAGVGNLQIIEGIMARHVYTDILKNKLKPRVMKLSLQTTFRFQEGNDPKYIAKKAHKNGCCTTLHPI